MAVAYLTQGETLKINNVNIPKIVSSPELGSTPSKLDATNLASEMMTYIPGLPDHSGELTWTLNADPFSESGGNTAVLNALSPDTEYPIVVTKQRLGVTIRFTGYVAWAFAAASVNAVQQITLTITPTSGYTYAAVSP